MIKPYTKEELRSWRGDRTQVAAAQSIGLPYDTYRSYENGYRPIPPTMRNTVAGATLNEGKSNVRSIRRKAGR